MSRRSPVLPNSGPSPSVYSCVTWASHLTSLSLGFVTYKTQITLLPRIVVTVKFNAVCENTLKTKDPAGSLPAWSSGNRALVPCHHFLSAHTLCPRCLRLTTVSTSNTPLDLLEKMPSFGKHLTCLLFSAYLQKAKMGHKFLSQSLPLPQAAFYDPFWSFPLQLKEPGTYRFSISQEVTEPDSSDGGMGPQAQPLMTESRENL